jgi:hypothetical protein
MIKCSRAEQPVCCQCGGVVHNGRNCPPLKRVVDQKHGTKRRRRKRRVQPSCPLVKPSTFEIKMSMIVYTPTEKHRRRMSSDYRHRSSSDCNQTGHRSRAAREKVFHKCALHTASGELISILKKAFVTDPEAAPFENLGVPSIPPKSPSWDSTPCAPAIQPWN